MVDPIILKVMGKLKFTFSNLWYWAALILTCTITENLMHMTSSPKAGFNYSGLIIISIACIACLFMFYFASHKENRVKVDWILLPGIIIVGICLLVGIWANKGMTIPFENGTGEIEVSFSFYERLRATIILFIFLALMYAMLFVSRTNGFRNRVIIFVALVGISAALISLTYSLIAENAKYAAIFKEDYDFSIEIYSFYGNKNYYGGVLFIGFLSCIISNYYKPRFYKYLLMLIFSLALMASAAMLPTLIAIGGLIIYLFEEIARFSFKKRWICMLFALITLLSLLALIIVFYYGVSHEWKGFNGLDQYLSEVFHKKNFSTLSGRIKIWKKILPYCFDSTFHTIFGHGFMISEKTILGITAAMANGSSGGVRTTHNGYLQVAFEYGVIGIVVHIALIGFFLYSCVRMLMEKKFHFVFVYLFVGLCAATYNFCESSSYFDAGTKELFMTQLFAVPVMVEAKMVSNRKKIEEIHSIEVNEEPINAISLGRGAALIIISALVAVCLTFISTLTFEIIWLKYLMMNLAVGLGILLLFVPYLLTLYRKNTDNLFFVLHIVSNTVFFGLIAFISFLAMWNNAELREMIKYFYPILLFLVLLIDTIIYALAKNGSIKEWCIVALGGSFAMARYAIIGAVLLGGLSYLIFSVLDQMNLFIYFMCMIISFIAFYGAYYFFPTKSGRIVRNDLNKAHIDIIKQEFEMNEKYYG